MSIRVLLADDQAMVRAGFRMILESEPDIEVVGEAEDGAKAVAQARALRPDVVLMDVRMPNMDGLEATRQIAALGSPEPVRVLILTTFERDEYIFEALRSGASGFMLKNAAPEELIEAVRIVAGGNSLLAPSVTRRVIEEFAKGPAPTAVDTSRLNVLTEREAEVLACSPAANPTPRSPTSSSSAKPPSRPTSPTCSPSSTSATASRPSSSPTNPASSAPGTKLRVEG